MLYGEIMNENILKYLKEFNEIANISIEYAVLEPHTSISGELKNNLHVVFTPKLKLLLESYVSGISLDVLNETVIDTSNIHAYLVNHYIPKENLSKVPQKDLMKDINSLVISNIARFYNFKFKESTDPFLSMFLEEENIIWKTRDFDIFFFSKKETYKPSKVFVANSVLSELKDNNTRVRELSQSYGNKKEELSKVYDKLHNNIKLYFIALRYLRTDELSSTLEDTSELILSTLVQASKPWEYVEDCIKVLSTEIAKAATNDRPDSRNALKGQAMNFLEYKICEDVETLFNPQ